MSGQEPLQVPQSGQPTIQVLLHTGNPPSTTTEQPPQDGGATSTTGGQYKPLADIYTTNQQAPATPEQLPPRENGKGDYSM